MRTIGNLVITLEDDKEEDIEVRTKKIDEARKNLGHWKNKSSKSTKQFPVSLETAIRMSESIFTVDLTSPEAQMLYQGVYRPKAKYPLR